MCNLIHSHFHKTSAEMVIIFLLCLCFTLQNLQVDGRNPNFSKNGFLDLEERLKVINKPPIKSIQTEFGHIVDCIDINNQLAFDNPLLRNHKIQLKPSFLDSTTELMVKDTIFPTLGKNLCPKGAVPVRRTTKEDLKHESLFSNNINTLTQDTPGTHFAGAQLNLKENIYNGIVGDISVYTPTVSRGQMSSAYIWLSNRANLIANEINIQAGWQVNPTLFGDDKARFYASWSNGIEKTGCTNLRCPGFVQTSQSIYLGMPLISNTSINVGPIFTLGLALTKDETTNHWWLLAQNTRVGYFPAPLFSNNFTSANQGGWTGKTVSDTHFSPPMGSGHLPDGDYRHSAYIARLEFQDQTGLWVEPALYMIVLHGGSPPQCYDVTWDKYDDEHGLEQVMEFGGPGGNCEYPIKE